MYPNKGFTDVIWQILCDEWFSWHSAHCCWERGRDRHRHPTTSDPGWRHSRQPGINRKSAAFTHSCERTHTQAQSLENSRLLSAPFSHNVKRMKVKRHNTACLVTKLKVLKDVHVENPPFMSIKSYKWTWTCTKVFSSLYYYYYYYYRKKVLLFSFVNNRIDIHLRMLITYVDSDIDWHRIRILRKMSEFWE